MSAPAEAAGGWAFPTPEARRAHYFPAPNGRSLCGKYGSFGLDLAPDHAPALDDCTPCRRKLDGAR
jgi:hypothetical protein